jgi:hypothetical protein
MVSKCANPGCPVTFRYLRDGRLFLVEDRAQHQLRHYWLCGSCSLAMTVVPQHGRAGIELVPRPATRKSSSASAA